MVVIGFNSSGSNVGALIIRIGFDVYDTRTTIRNPHHNFGNYLGPQKLSLHRDPPRRNHYWPLLVNHHIFKTKDPFFRLGASNDT